MQELSHDDLFEYLSAQLSSVYEVLMSSTYPRAPYLIDTIVYIDQGMLQVHDELYLEDQPDFESIHVSLILLVNRVSTNNSFLLQTLGMPFLRAFRLWAEGVMTILEEQQQEPVPLQSAPAA